MTWGHRTNYRMGLKKLRNLTYFLESPSEQLIIKPPDSCPRPVLFPLPSVQSSSGSMSLFATQSLA